MSDILPEELRAFADHGITICNDHRITARNAADEIERLRHDIERHVRITTSQQAEIERLRAALAEIAELGDVRCDEAPSIARRALIAAE